jgi:NADH-quinone oxidoreductase subunit H
MYKSIIMLGKNLFFLIIYWLTLLVPLLIAIALLTLVERKVMAAMQRRRGPNVVGYFGLLQPFADGLKLLLKETIIPIVSNKLLFFFAPIFSFFLSLALWVVIPFDFGKVLSDLNLGILYALAFSSLSVYGIIVAGWSANSRYAFLGSIRAIAQMLSYEVFLGLIILNLVLVTGTLNISKICLIQTNSFFVSPFLHLAILFFISCLAETNRPPFDLPEAEAELVAGYHVEYSSMTFALFFLGEYSNIIFNSALIVVLFFGGWLPPFFLNFMPFSGVFYFSVKVLFFAFLFVWIRATLPRYRYDQLMKLGWKIFLPIALTSLIFSSAFFVAFA